VCFVRIAFNRNLINIKYSFDCSVITYRAFRAVQCSAVQCSAVKCSAVQCSAVQCSAVITYRTFGAEGRKVGLWPAVWGGRGAGHPGSAVQFCALQCSAVQCSAVQCSAVQCSAVHPVHIQPPGHTWWSGSLLLTQCSAVQCSPMQCSAVQCSAVQWWSGSLLLTQPQPLADVELEYPIIKSPLNITVIINQYQ
jgi:hypothetical protein